MNNRYEDLIRVKNSFNNKINALQFAAIRGVIPDCRDVELIVSNYASYIRSIDEQLSIIEDDTILELSDYFIVN
jgi:aspartate/glutamate racemase